MIILYFVSDCKSKSAISECTAKAEITLFHDALILFWVNLKNSTFFMLFIYLLLIFITILEFWKIEDL